ncbi:cation:proton antiporter [Chloroflexota bacterium]
MIVLVIVTCVFIAYALFSRRLLETSLSPYMVFVTVGIVVSLAGLISMEEHDEGMLLLGEVTLALILFTDAARIDIRALRGSAEIPARLLLVGLPLTILLGTVAAALLFPELLILEAAILAVVLAPTDAGLGQAVVNSPLVPVRMREALNVESGLNDGIATPILMIFIALAEAEATHEVGFWFGYAVQELLFGLLVGLLVGVVGGWLLGQASKNNAMLTIYRWLTFGALAILAWSLGGVVGGNGFIAAFVAGLMTAIMLGHVGKGTVEFGEATGQLLSLAVFFLFGVLLVGNRANLNWSMVLYGILSLTAIRMIPVALALMGARLRPASTVFLGWFGPRGLASIVLALIVVKEAGGLQGLDTIISAVMVTVLFSIFAHGITAQPAIQRYTRRLADIHEAAPELQDVTQMPTRRTASPLIRLIQEEVENTPS